MKRKYTIHHLLCHRLLRDFYEVDTLFIQLLCFPFLLGLDWSEDSGEELDDSEQTSPYQVAWSIRESLGYERHEWVWFFSILTVLSGINHVNVIFTWSGISGIWALVLLLCWNKGLFELICLSNCEAACHLLSQFLPNLETFVQSAIRRMHRETI